tara:strand:- start:42 stop:746 length:705 start_codon:yes stop_codon:yes gene_type:complete
MTDKPVMIITGTRKGIGKHLSEYYAGKNFQVIGCSRNQIDSELDNYKHYCLDVSDELGVKHLFTEIRNKYGRLDALINNVGITSKNHVLLTSLKEVHDLLDTNFVGSFLFCRESVKLMKINKFGRIVNISSIHIPLASVGTSIYGASKAAIEQFSKILAKEVFQFGINVNTISLSVVKDTGMGNYINNDTKERIINQTISKSQLTIKDIINAINFLISENSDMITNQILYLGGV